MSEEWGPWIKHDGKGCPCKGRWVISEERCGLIEEHVAMSLHLDGPGNAWIWGTGSRRYEIIRYRIRRPRPLLQLIEMVENLPAPAKPRVDA